MSALDLLELFTSGKEIQFSISLIEGLNWRGWLLVLKSHSQIQFSDDFTQISCVFSGTIKEICPIHMTENLEVSIVL